MDKKKGIVGSIGAVAVAAGGFLWNNMGGKDVATDVATKVTKQVIAPAVLEKMPPELQVPMKAILESASLSPSDEQSLSAFADAYQRCQDRAATNSKVDLKSSVAVYDYSVKCLLVEENQGATLEKMAEKSEELKLTLAEIREKISQQP